MSTARGVHHTYEDYLQLEPGSPHKLEYCDGEIYAKAGGSPEHGALAMQFVRLTSSSLQASPSTEEYDRGDKLSHDKQLAWLEAVIDGVA